MTTVSICPTGCSYDEQDTILEHQLTDDDDDDTLYQSVNYDSFWLDSNSTEDKHDYLSGSEEDSMWNDDTRIVEARFAAETTVAVVSALLNASVLAKLLAGACAHWCCWSTGSVTRPTQMVYRSLFINLMLANSLSSVLSWLCNNIFYLASDQFKNIDICTYLIFLAAAFFLSTMFGLASILTVLGFAVVQYFAICRPLQNMAVVSTTKVKCLSHCELVFISITIAYPKLRGNWHLRARDNFIFYKNS